MTDRYKEFKLWAKCKLSRVGVDWDIIFDDFEHEQEEKQKEIIIKRRIGELVYENVTGGHICVSVNGIYDGLKDMGLLNDRSG